MIAGQDLLDAYHSWEQWTQSEGLAIQAGNWPQVAQCQKTKQELKQQILNLVHAATADGTESGMSPSELGPELRRIIAGLIGLETRNARLLAERRQTAEGQWAELENTSRNLRRVQKSYIRPSPALWHSYS